MYDLISRKALLKKLNAVNLNGIGIFGCGAMMGIEHAKELVVDAPAVHITSCDQRNKSGHWIIHSYGFGKNATNWAECSECHTCGSPKWRVCPVCETRMEKQSVINSEIDFDYAAEDMD